MPAAPVAEARERVGIGAGGLGGAVEVATFGRAAGSRWQAVLQAAVRQSAARSAADRSEGTAAVTWLLLAT